LAAAIIAANVAGCSLYDFFDRHACDGTDCGTEQKRYWKRGWSPLLKHIQQLRHR
jgi:hypothetical protein